MTIRILAPFALFALTGACTDPGSSTPRPAAANTSDRGTFSGASRQWRLPPALAEVSGLAGSSDGRVFAHDDEDAVIYELDPMQGRLLSNFAVGDPERGDFEGLAIAPDGAFWLVESTGVLLRFNGVADGARVTFERHDTGLGDVCEVEGLAYATTEQSLILACKRSHSRGMDDTLRLYAWRPNQQARLWRSFDVSDVTEAAGVENFRPSSVEIDARTGDVWLLSAHDAAVAQFGEDGALRGAWALGSRHVQAEGLTLLPDGAIVIADEGGAGRALLSVYEGDHD